MLEQEGQPSARNRSMDDRACADAGDGRPRQPEAADETLPQREERVRAGDESQDCQEDQGLA